MKCRGIRLAPVLLGCCLHAQAEPWTELSDDCLSAMTRSQEAADSLAAACPELSEALADDPWSEVLAIQADALSPWGVVELSAMAERYERPARGPRVAGATLDVVLAGLPAQAEEKPLSLWERFRRWLLGLLDDGDETLPNWLAEISISPRAMEWIWYASIGVIVLLTAAVAGNEIRRQARRRAARAAAGPSTARGACRFPGEAPGSTPGEQLVALFRLIVARLEAAGVVPRRPSLTHRQIGTAPTLTAPQRQIVSSVGGAAERATYGRWEPEPEDVEPHLESGRRLLNDLAGGPG